jgi:hypothetical protein
MLLPEGQYVSEILHGLPSHYFSVAFPFSLKPTHNPNGYFCFRLVTAARAASSSWAAFAPLTPTAPKYDGHEDIY